MIRDVRVGDLRRGSIFTMNGERHRILYVNTCRALVQRVGLRTVALRRVNPATGIPEKHNFQVRSASWSISPGSIVQIDRRSA